MESFDLIFRKVNTFLLCGTRKIYSAIKKKNHDRKLSRLFAVAIKSMYRLFFFLVRVLFCREFRGIDLNGAQAESERKRANIPLSII